MRTPLRKRELKMAIDLPAIKIVRTTPPNLGGGAAVDNRLTAKPVAPAWVGCMDGTPVRTDSAGVWDEFLQLQISPATRRSYAAGLSDFFGGNFKQKFRQRRF